MKSEDSFKKARKVCFSWRASPSHGLRPGPYSPNGSIWVHMGPYGPIWARKMLKFEKRSVPNEINYSPIFDIVSFDSNNKKTNLIMGGNQYLVKPQFGRYDASKGWIFTIKNTNNDKIHFNNLRSLNIEGQIRKFGIIETVNEKLLITAINDKEFKFFEIDN